MPTRSLIRRNPGGLAALRTCLAVAILSAAAGCPSNSKIDPSSTPNSGRSPLEAGNAERGGSNGQSGSNATGPAPHIQFDEVTSRYAVDFDYRNGEDTHNFTILESLGGGVAFVDYDADGWPDLFCPGGGTFENQQAVGFPAALYRSIDGASMAEVSQSAGGGFPARCYTHGAFAADYNADGFTDILLSGYGGLHLWQNQGDGTFAEVHQVTQLTDPSWSSGAGWGDFNGDGLLDLYVVHYVDWSFENHPFCRGRTKEERDICPPREFSPLPDTLYINRGDGTFREATSEWNLRDDGKGLGVLVADFDGDGWVDVYVANDTVNNFLYINEGGKKFREVAPLSGVAADQTGMPNGSMGVDILDFDHTGRPDIWVTNYEREDFALYRNEGPSAFLHVSNRAGLSILGGLFVGFGTTCSDLDLDGDEDILINNGHVILYPTASPRAQLPLVLECQDPRFVRLNYTGDSYLTRPHEGRGLAVADMDRDGDLDAAYSNLNAPVALLENVTEPRGNWLRVELVGRASNRDAIGAVATLRTGGKSQIRHRRAGGSYMSSNESALYWGVAGATTIDQLEVQWPSGRRSIIENVSPNQSLRLVEPDEK